MARAWESEPRAVAFDDIDPVFTGLAFDPGWLLSASDPISVRFSVTPTGGIAYGWEGTSELTWSPVAHTITGEPGSGYLDVEAEVEIATEAQINLGLLGTYVVPLAGQTLRLDGTEAFDPPALGQPVTVIVDDPALVPPFEFDIAVITGVDLQLSVEVTPRLETTFTATSLTSTHQDGGSWLQLTDDTAAAASLPAGSPASLDLETVAAVQAYSLLTLVLEPTATVDTWIGSFQLVSFPIPITLVDVDVVKSLASGPYSHPLPAFRPTSDEYDFGVVTVGERRTLELPLPNAGQLPVDGTLRIEGDAGFSVYPDRMFIPPAGLDGVTIDFEPSVVGGASADLVFESNDPTAPSFRLHLGGEGWLPDDTGAPADPDGGLDTIPVAEAEVKSCGCATGPGPSVAWIAGLALLIRRRR